MAQDWQNQSGVVNSQQLSGANVPQGGVDDGRFPPTEVRNPLQEFEMRIAAVEAKTRELAAKHAQLDSAHQTIAGNAAASHSGTPSQQIVTVREELPRGGFLHHDVVIESDGFGHHHVTNMKADAPHFTSFDAARASIKDGAKFEGPIKFGTMRPDGTFVEDGTE